MRRIRVLAFGWSLLAVACGPPPAARTPAEAEGPSGSRPEAEPRQRPPAPPLRVGTWNLKRLGHGEKDVERVAAIVDRMDVVALQEVMDPEGVAELVRALPDGWRAAVTETAVGRSSYREHYAVVYREAAVRMLGWYALEDPQDAFEREPMVACLLSGELDFCVVSIHVVYGDRVGPRDAEIRTLIDRVGDLRAGTAEKDWLIVGDFNRKGSAPGWDAAREDGWTFADGDGATVTTIGRDGYASAYDHVLLDERHTREWDGSVERIDILREACDGDPARCRSSVSDHAPVRIRLRTDGPDDDGRIELN